MHKLRPSFNNLAFGKLLNMNKRSFGTSSTTDSESYKHDKLIYPAATRNKQPILEVLNQLLEFSKDEKPLFLEISSGSGQHIAHFAPNFPNITFQPSEVEADLLGSIAIYADECPTKNINQPMLIDICKDLGAHGFKQDSIDVIYNANMIHISPYECTINLFINAGKYLKPSGMMVTYGPYAHNGLLTPESNVNFHQSLQCRDPRWGIRDICDLEKLASENSLYLKRIFEMPANNKCLLWVKNSN